VRLHRLEQEVSYMLADLLDSQMEIAETLHEKQFSSYMRGEDVL
jgi:NOL1/NOP2/fmu family ribosome biogenesis protein